MKNTLILFLFIFFASCNSDKNIKIKSITKDVDKIEKNNLTQLEKREIKNKVILSGRIDVIPNDKIEVYTPYNGYIKNINIIEGDIVKKGSILFEVENIELAKLQSNFIELNNSFIQIKKEFNRQEELFKNNAISEKIYLEYQTIYLNLLNQIKFKKKELDYYGVNTTALLENNELTNVFYIKAKENVIVSKININKGKFVDKNDLLVELYKTEHLLVELDAPSKYINLVNEKDFVGIKHNNESFKGIIYRISKAIDNTSNMFKIHVHFDKNPEIPIGSFVTGEMNLSKYVYSIENDAIFERNGIEYVNVYDENTEKRISILTGIKDDSFTEVINYVELINNKIIK